jgi:hypothetical protein
MNKTRTRDQAHPVSVPAWQLPILWRWLCRNGLA